MPNWTLGTNLETWLCWVSRRCQAPATKLVNRLTGNDADVLNGLAPATPSTVPQALTRSGGIGDDSLVADARPRNDYQ
jgi:hypothetical protein